MRKSELERWLCGPDVPPLPPASIAAALGLAAHAVADTTLLRTAARLLSLRFTLAVLRDAFSDDADVRRWLDEPRAELAGATPLTLLRAGHTEPVEELAVQAWNESSCIGTAV